MVTSCACANFRLKLENIHSNVFKFELGKFKMASNREGYGHSGERSNSGRKRKEQNDCGKNHKQIYLESRIFQSWLQTKFDASYEFCSDSDFTAQ